MALSPNGLYACSTPSTSSQVHLGTPETRDMRGPREAKEDNGPGSSHVGGLLNPFAVPTASTCVELANPFLDHIPPAPKTLFLELPSTPGVNSPPGLDIAEMLWTAPIPPGNALGLTF